MFDLVNTQRGCGRTPSFVTAYVRLGSQVVFALRVSSQLGLSIFWVARFTQSKLAPTYRVVVCDHLDMAMGEGPGLQAHVPGVHSDR